MSGTHWDRNWRHTVVGSDSRGGNASNGRWHNYPGFDGLSVKGWLLAQGPAECFWCALPLGSRRSVITIEHIIPMSRGGLTTPENVALACASCNQAKGSMTPLEWVVSRKFPSGPMGWWGSKRVRHAITRITSLPSELHIFDPMRVR